jgi:DNA-binding winged helix-turn-helix (wHTH) protein/serine/threonine protein kinase
MATISAGRMFSGRVWRFSDCEFDDLRMALRAGENEVKLEPKPLEMLHVLLSRAGEVITKQELLDAVWGDEAVVEGVLTTNINKLREAIGDLAKKTIVTIRGIGYKLTGSVQWEHATSTVEEVPAIVQGSTIPGREQWRLTRRLDASAAAGGVWLATHTKTHEERVFKFAMDGERLRSLKREATLSRVLHKPLASRPEFIRILEWNFENRPFFLESEFGGPNLADWAEEQGGLLEIPLEARLQIVAATARAVATAHDLGVLHKDLKPNNILVTPGPDSSWQIRLVDFGSGTLLDPAHLRDLGITDAGVSSEQKMEISGTLMYCAPELQEGNPCTACSDVFALGILLYQAIQGSFRASLASGWESSIDDPLLREDIGLAACGDPKRRLATAAELAQRLENLEARRLQREKAALAEQRALVAERKLQTARARRPWVVAALAILIVGLASSLALYSRAVRERDRANRQTAIADAIDQFLARDLLGRADPVVAGKPDETLLGAVKQAMPEVDRQFHNQPLVAAQLHSTIARSLGLRDDAQGAVREFMAAANCYVQAQGELSEDAMVERLKAAMTQSRTYSTADLQQAKQTVDAQQVLAARVHNPKPEIALYTAIARGYIAFASNDIKGAADQIQQAIDKGAITPSFDEASRTNLKHMLAATYVRLGEGQKAEQLAKDVIATYSRLYGMQSPKLLQADLTLAQALMVENRHREVVELTTEVYPGFLKIYGDSNQYSLQILSTRATSEAALESWDAAIQDEVTIHTIALKAQGPLGLFSTVPFSDLAMFECQSGRYSQGIPTAKMAYQQTQKAFANRSGLVDSAAFALAFCDLGGDKTNEAAALLAKIDSGSIAQLTGDPAFGANVALAKAQVALKQGDRGEAAKQFGLAQQAFQHGSPNSFQKRWYGSVQSALQKHG